MYDRETDARLYAQAMKRLQEKRETDKLIADAKEQREQEKLQNKKNENILSEEELEENNETIKYIEFLLEKLSNSNYRSITKNLVESIREEVNQLNR